MNRTISLVFTGLLFATLVGCISVHGERGFHDEVESCSVMCAKGGHAEVSCAKPKVPACHCEPDVAAACVSASHQKPSVLM